LEFKSQRGNSKVVNEITAQPAAPSGGLMRYRTSALASIQKKTQRRKNSSVEKYCWGGDQDRISF
jgi:hypothetical protein